MKKVLLTIISFFVFTSVSFAGVVYVSSFKTTLYSMADRKSMKIATLKRGVKLTLLSTEGAWLQVQFAGKKGWVTKMVTSTKKPGMRVSLLGNADQNTRIFARKRASSDVTAASARGLLDDDSKSNVKGRSRMSESGSDQFNTAVLSKMEDVKISEDELMSFLSEYGVQ